MFIIPHTDREKKVPNARRTNKVEGKGEAYGYTPLCRQKREAQAK